MTIPQGRILVAGGGIGGLSAAIALARRGIESEVLERSLFGEEAGAGIQLGPNATRLLREIGVLDAIAPSAFSPESILIYDGLSGRNLGAVPLGAHIERRYGAPYLTLHRADLHAGLHSVAQALAAVTLRPGFDIAAIDMQSAGIVLRAADGSHAAGKGLIGADGLWSTVRTLIAPEARLRFTGQTAWRTLLPRRGLPPPFDAPAVGLWLGPRSHLVHYPVRAGELLNVVAVTEGGAALQGWNRPVCSAALLPSFARWTKGCQSLLEGAENWRSWSLFRLAGLRKWSVGRVALLGDAAHPVLPYLAQGAALAIEDASVLAACLAGTQDLPCAYGRYEAARRYRTARVGRLSQHLGRLYHLCGPLRLVRNAILAHRNPDTALRRFDWLYREARR